MYWAPGKKEFAAQLLGLVLTLQGLAHSFGRFYKRALSKA
jgi:hypothetical protein